MATTPDGRCPGAGRFDGSAEGAAEDGLARATSFRIGGRARELYRSRSVAELVGTLGRLRDRCPHILGGGCNTLFPDGEFHRPVVATGGLQGLAARAGRLRAECGVSLGRLLGVSASHGSSGLEAFAGIPGTLGGAVVMNAGGGGIAFGDLVEDLGVLELATGEVVRLRGRDVPWTYRSWGLAGCVVLWAELRLSPASPARVREGLRTWMERKRRTQPLHQPSAGCVFKNPPGGSAAELIDRAGLKGTRAGGAEVSPRHANFIVNRGGARAEDVRRLIARVRERVRAASGVHLETELVLAEDDEGGGDRPS